MATPTRYGGYTASFDSLVVDQCMGVDVSPSVSLMLTRPMGSLYNAFVATAFADPTISIQTTDVETILGSSSVSTPLGVSTGAEVQYQLRVDCATFASGSNHVTLNSTAGCLVVNSISASTDDTTGAMLNATFYSHFDGTNLPVTVATSQALANAPAHNQSFTLGGVKIGTTQITGVQSVQISTGIQYQTVRTDGDPWPRTGSVISISPAITLTGHHIGVLDDTTLFGDLLGGTITIYLQKMAADGSARVAQATAEHIAITAAAGGYNPDSISVSGTSDAIVSYSIPVTGAALGQSIDTAITNIG